MEIREKKKFWTSFIVLVSIAGLCVFLIVSRHNANKTNDVKRSSAQTDNSSQVVTIEDPLTPTTDTFDGSVQYNGKRYEVNRSLEKVLFLGVDTSDLSREGIGIDEGARSDVIILFVIDNDNETILPLEINRDTMVDIDIYDNDGNFLTKGQKQLAMQYAYGDNPQRACNLTKEKVSDLLGRTRIKNVVSLTMDGIEPIVDSIGGIDIKLSTDETDLDPSYTEGAVIHLDGVAAKAFVHDRDVTTRGSNISRMSRQTQFMIALFQTIKSKGDSVIETMENAAGDYLYEDIDADSMNHLTHYDYSDTVLTLPGENKTGNIHDEFYIDDNKLTEMILNLFYEES